MKTSLFQTACIVLLAAGFLTGPATELNAQKHMVYAVLHDEGNLAIVDPEKGQLVQRIQIGRAPDMIALNADASKVFVSNTGEITVSIVSLKEKRVSQVLRLPVNRRGIFAGPIARTPDGLKIFVAERGEKDDEQLRVYVIDTQKELIVGQCEAGKNIAAMSVSNDGRKLFVLNKGEGLRVFGVDDLQQTGTVDLLPGLVADASGIACSPASPKGYVIYGAKNKAQAFNTDTYAPGAEIAIPKYKTGNQTGIHFGQDGRFAFVINRKTNLKEVDGVNVIEASKDEVVKLFNSGVVERGIMTSPDGKTCYIAAEELKWYNMETLEHIRSISLRTRIAGIAVVNK